jgi:c-di-GMP-binding flagellar brake protein YcgR
MEIDKRKYPRARKGLDVRFVEESVAPNVGEYLNGLAADIGLGGMFIATEETHSEGTVLSLELNVDDPSGDTSLVRARAVVRWIRPKDEPRGMGVEFIEFDGLKNLSLEEYLSKILEQDRE